MMPRSPTKPKPNALPPADQDNTEAVSPTGVGERSSVPAANPECAHIDNYQVRLPPPEMDTRDLQSFFWVLEHWFAATGITARMDQRRFHIVMAQLPAKVLPEVRPLLEQPPDQERYNFVKNTLIAHFQESQRSRLQRLLSSMELGDRKPSQLLTEMQRTAANAMSEAMLLDLWIGRLPPNVQAAVIATRGEARDQARVADAVMDCLVTSASHGRHYPVSEVHQHDDRRIERELADLRHQVQKLTAAIQRESPRKRNSRSRAQTPSRGSPSPATKECYYHRRFGTAARRCQSPCSFKKPVQEKTNPDTSRQSL